MVGFSATIWKIRFLTSLDSLLLPTCFLTLEIRLQYKRNPLRCQRTTVSGVTTRRDCFQADQNLRASTQKSLSRGLSLGLGFLRFRTVSCCRSARFSRSRLWRERKKRATAPNQSQKKPNMDESCSRGMG